MNPNQLHPQLLTVSGLFAGDTTYTVPIYQRNYAWGAAQIEQLISDIQDAVARQESGQESGYFLGNLVVTPRDKSGNNFEVIDGQQRLTTLYLLLTLLQGDGSNPWAHHQGRLQYASRARAAEALRRVGQETSLPPGQAQGPMADDDGAIHDGFNIIQQHEKLRHPADRHAFADFLRTCVTVVRASLPPKTDLNRYFEIMNTRGEQLQPVDIVKARLMSQLPESERATFAWIWDACADMDVYVQMALTRGSTDLREKIFGPDWSWLELSDFAALALAFVSAHSSAQPEAATGMATQALSLDDALQKYARGGESASRAEEGSERFRSTIEFPVFLLHVLKVVKGGEDEDEGQLDDKRLIQSFTKAMPSGQEAQWVRHFAFTLLRCRNLFDNFILKRQFAVSAEDDEGDWSLQRLKRNMSKGKSTPGYAPVFRHGDTAQDSEPDSCARDVLLLQSMLRITYTSPRTMHWMTKTLQWLVRQPEPQAIGSAGLANFLKDFARAKAASVFLHTEPRPQGFGIARIVFTYLDYLLLDEQAKRNFKFQFRNSIEHFYPRKPVGAQSAVSQGNLHCLGNLALVSVSANSKFSNYPPEVKADYSKGSIEAQSPKLQRMAEITRREGWGDEQIQKHHRDMLGLLAADIQKR